MSKAFPLSVKKSKDGRPRKEGPRETNGRRQRGKGGAPLPEPPTPELLAHREALEVVNPFQDPLDVALEHGWLTGAEHRAGRLFLSLFLNSQRGFFPAQRVIVDMEGANIFSEPEKAIVREEVGWDWSICELS